MFENIRIVLVNTSHPGNIGAAARAMKTMSLTNLCLVAPKEFPHNKAFEMASNAGDVLTHATVCQSLEEAIADCQLVVGTSTRNRAIPWPLMSPHTFAKYAFEQPKACKIAILFGREQSGLTNEELQLCHYHINIPSNPDYSSLNLAAAVQVICYELQCAALSHTPTTDTWDYPVADGAQLAGFYTHLEKVLIEIDFLKESAPRQLMARLKRLFNRTQLDVMEVNILRGILTAISRQKSG